MTMQQVAVNNRALIAAAAKLEQAGYDGDAYRFVESLVLSVLADGYRRIEKPDIPPPACSTREARMLALKAAQDAIDAAKRRRTTVNEETA